MAEEVIESISPSSTDEFATFTMETDEFATSTIETGETKMLEEEFYETSATSSDQN